MVLFRTDGNEKIGLGHVMRCLSIATALRDKSIDVMFALADNNCKKVVEQNGFSYVVLASLFDNLDSEIEQVINLVDKYNIDIIVVDSYFVTPTYFKAIRKKARVVYIDDVLSFPYQVNMLINYNVFSSQEAYNSLYIDSLEKPDFLLGTDYVPLRKEFYDCSNKVPNKIVKNVLVLTGGGDPEHVGIRFLNYIRKREADFSNMTFYFVIGLANKDCAIMQEIAMNMKNIILLQNVRKMRELMNISDLAISASGSTLYELAVTGVPTISYVIATNQIDIADSFERKGITQNVGDINYNPYFESSVFHVLSDLINNFALRKEMVNKGYKEIKKNGSSNIAEKIAKLM